MGNLVNAKVSLEGTRPLLFHRFGSHSIPLEKQERSGVPGNDPDEWRESFFATPEGQLYLPPTYPFACIKEGAAFTRRGRGNLRKVVASTLQILDALIVIVDRFVPSNPMLVEQGTVAEPLPPVYVDVSGVRNPSSTGRQIRYRLATAPGWQCSVQLQWDKTVISRGEMESICIDAGKLVGLGDGRSIGFGRFQVNAFTVMDSESPRSTEEKPLGNSNTDDLDVPVPLALDLSFTHSVSPTDSG